MRPQRSFGLAPYLDRLPVLTAAIGILVGASALIGWQWDITPLKSILPGLVAMNPLTATAFVCSGGSLTALRYLSANRTLTLVGYALATAITLIGVLKLCDVLWGSPVHLDQLLFRDKLGGSVALPPNRMAPNTALNFVLLGLSLLTLKLELRRGLRPAQFVAFLPLGFSLLAILGYVFNVHQLYGVKTFIPMALNTALTFWCLSMAVLFAHPDRGITRVFLAEDAGGTMARRVMPFALLVPVLLAWVRFHPQRAGLFGVEPGISVMVLSCIVLLTGFIWLNATRLSRAESGRRAAVEELKHAHDALDVRVRERTGELEETNQRLRAEIDERVRAEEALRVSETQLRQAQKMEAVGRLAGGVAHDFNNLLTAIMGYSQLVRSRPGVDDAVIRDIAEVEKAAARAASLTRQLLAFSRQQVLQPKVLDLNKIIVDIDKMLHRLIGEDIDLLTVPTPELDHVKADPGQIEQVVLNLVVNARDAMADGGKLTIETRNVALDEAAIHGREGLLPGPYVMLAVSDNGTGMDAETRSRIFEPFFTTKEVGRGTGLGLSTVHGIVKQSGGHIEVYSEQGQGSTFKVYLPRVEAPLDAAAPAVPISQDRGGSETILIVEDEELVRKVVSESLRLKGYTIIEAADRTEAFEVCETCQRNQVQVDLMLSDVVMPGMSMAELAKRLQSLNPALKVIYMSGYTDKAMMHQGVLEDGAAFLQKPFTTDALLHKVREVLEEPRRAAA